MSSEQNASNTRVVAEPFYVTTAQAVRMLGCDNQKLWRLAKAGKLSPPRRLSPRRCVWLQDNELEALGGKLQPVQDGYFKSPLKGVPNYAPLTPALLRCLADSHYLNFYEDDFQWRGDLWKKVHEQR